MYYVYYIYYVCKYQCITYKTIGGKKKHLKKYMKPIYPPYMIYLAPYIKAIYRKPKKNG